jgi:hypothetical protein
VQGNTTISTGHTQSLSRQTEKDYISQEVFKLEKAIPIFGHEKEAVIAPFKEV